MRKLRLLFATCALLIGTAVSWAQTDVTSMYLTNADFSSMDGWTLYASSQFHNEGCGKIGSLKVTNSYVATVDATHLATENCLEVQCRWSSNYSSYNQETSELPAGLYKLSYDVENPNGSTTKATYNNLFYLKIGETTYTDASTEWMNGKSSWTTHSRTFALTEASTVTVSLGYGTGNNNFGTGSTPHVFISHLKLESYGIPAALTDGGKYYFYNVGAQKFWGAGNDWGTRATLTDHPEFVTMHALADGTYTMESQVSNGGTNYYFGGDYMDGAAIPLYITKAGDGKYNVSNGSTFFGYDGSSTVLGKGLTDGSADNAKWIIYSEAEMNTILAAATADAPVDATWKILDANFGRNNRNSSSWQGTTLTKDGDNTNMNVQAYMATFNTYQTLSDMPNGVYRVDAQAAVTFHDNRVVKDYDGNGYPVVYANDETTNFNIMASADQLTSQATMSTRFSAGSYAVDPIILEVTDGTLTIGAKSDRNDIWAVWDNFSLTYYGNEVTLMEVKNAALVAEYNNLLSEASAVTGKMNSDVASALAAAQVDLATLTTEEALRAAISTLRTAISNANKSIANYAEVKAALDAASTKAATFDEAGQAAYDVNAVQTAYNDGTITDSDYATYIQDITDALAVAAKAQTTAGSDMTPALANPSFELGNMTGWSKSEDATNTAVTQGNKAFDNTQGDWYAERWHVAGSFDVRQTVTGLPGGFYRVSAYVYSSDVEATLFANEMQTKVPSAASNPYSVELAIDNNESITLGLSATLGDNTWICLDHFTLTYLGALPDVTAVEGKMNNDVAAAQTAAVSAYAENKTVANYNAALAAVNAANTSVDAYSAAANALTDANAVKTAHTFATAEATTTFATAISTIQTAYDNGTLSDADAKNAGVTLGTAVTGWHGNASGAAVQYLNDGFGLHDFDQALYVNTWSNEGATDGTYFEVPFYEYWTGDDASLGEKTWTGTLTDLSNGQYTVTAWVRARIKNGDDVVDGETTTPAQASGLTFDVNGYDAVDFATNNTIGDGTGLTDTRFRLAQLAVTGLVKDGTLKFNINVAADNNISWVSFKNVSYQKVRDLTPEEMAVAPTAIALEPVTLTADNNTATLTPTFTPENATTTVTWTSSDEAVATVNASGVVTGVLPGTATITATSTIDTSVSGTCQVTVSYPESTLPATTYVNEGATRTILTLGENIIKNGSFEYPNALYGWQSGTRAALSTDNFNVVNSGAADGNHYLQAKQSKGQGDANSIYTAWPIEDGKTYVFSYKIKSNGDAIKASDLQYIGTSLSNDQNENSSKKFTTPDYSGKTEWTDVTYQFTNTDNYKYLVFSARWLGSAQSFDNFYLAESTTTTEGNVDYATAAIPTANIGTGAFQFSQAAIDEANALVQGTATVADVENAYNALTTINEPADGQLFNVILTYSGWTYDQKAMTYIANGRNDAGNYNIQYKEAANPNLAQAFTFTKVEGNKYTMSQIDADGVARYISTGVQYKGNTSQIRTTTDATKALAVTVIPTTTEGVWNLRNTEANQYIGSQDAGVYTVNSHINFNIVETQKPSVTINTTAAGWGTTILPFAATLPDGVKAYTISESNGNALTLVQADAIQANKPYVIEGSWNEKLTGDAQGTSLAYTDGLLTGTYTRIPAPNGSYILQKQGDRVGFFRVDTEVAQPNVPANRAYLTDGGASNARSSFLFEDSNITTAIGAVRSLTDGDAQVFDMNGVQQPRLKKGLNIIRTKDGRTTKVMVK